MAEVRRRHDPAVEQQESARRIREMENLSAATALTSQDEWTPLEYENGFADSGAGEQPGYYLDQMGRVWLRGIVQPGPSPAGKVIATLPEGWRPLAMARFSAAQAAVGGAARIEVETTGVIRWVNADNSSGSASLDGLSFRVENEGDDPIPGGGAENGGGSGPAGALKFVQTIGDGSTTLWPIAHNLGTSDVVIQVFEVATSSQVFPDVSFFTADLAFVNFGHPPAASSMKVVVIG